MPKIQMDADLLAAALVGLEHQKAAVEDRIADLRRMIGGRAVPRKQQATASAAPVKRRKMSAEGRKRIIDAAKKRWAAYRKAKKAAESPAE